jgi:hypothetical protein
VVIIREPGAFTIAATVSDEGAMAVASYEAGRHLPTFRPLRCASVVDDLRPHPRLPDMSVGSSAIIGALSTIVESAPANGKAPPAPRS